jgi:DsbC/DsbD-like thiol-disulfide interchange protein
VNCRRLLFSVRSAPLLEVAGVLSLFFCALRALSPAAVAAPQTLEGLKLELISETAEVRPGVPIDVGLKIEHASGFHTYWKNPGIVGVATQMKWNLPEGFSAGAIQWPAPQVTKMAIYPVYGYEGTIVLPVTITPPDSFDQKKLTEISISADVSWMCCAKTCHPGFATVSIALPTAEREIAPTFTKHQPLFAAAKATIPVKTDEWKASARRKGDQVIIQISPAVGGQANVEKLEKTDSVYFFSSDGLIDSTAPQTVTVLPGRSGLEITLKVSEFAPESTSTQAKLLGVLKRNQSWIIGSRIPAIEIETTLSVIAE